MNKYINNKLKYYPERVSDYLNNIPPSPITAQIQITNRCKYKCIYCDKLNNTSEIYITDNFIKRLKDLKIKSAILTGGEPLMHKDFDNVIRKIENNFKVGIVTTLCDYKEVLETIPTWIKVSLDTIDKKSYKKIKGIDNVDVVINNIKKLYTKKNKNITLGLQMVLCDENKNIEDILATYRELKDYCDYIQLRPIESKDNYRYSEDDFKILKIIKENFSDKFIISEKFFKIHKPKKCYAKWIHLVIDTNHNVMLCCNRTEDKISSIYDTDILKKVHAIKVNMNNCAVPCVMSVYNNYFESIYNGNHKEFV